MEFTPMGKISRIFRSIIVTEKIDGTNASIFIDDEGNIKAGSRTRWITPQDDNFGFARWVEENKEQLLTLGPGHHFGEWWGKGIQRGYGLNEKRFSLFNVDRWGETRPECCSVVPTLLRGAMDTASVQHVLQLLQLNGSVAAPGFMNPEGIVIFHAHSRQLFKATLGGDGHKG